MATVYTPDNCTEYKKEPDGKLTVFLAGTIDNGKSIDWQQELIKGLSDRDDIVLYNPRKASWDPHAGDVEVVNQILWELEMQDKVDIVVMNILPYSQSPICLLELGLHLGRQKPLILLCSRDYWRYNNVMVTAARYLPEGIGVMDNSKPDYLDELASTIRGVADNVKKALTDPRYKDELHELYLKTWSPREDINELTSYVLMDKISDKETEDWAKESANGAD